MSFNQHMTGGQGNVTVHRRPIRAWAGGIAVAFLAVACGCGPADEERPPLHPAQGSLLINDQPAEGAMLVFHRIGEPSFDARGTRPTATVDTEGSFLLTTYQAGDGAPAGEYQVAILWFDAPESNSPWDKLGGRLANPNRSSIQVTVEPGRDSLEPIRIDGVPIVPRPTSGNSRDLDQTE